MFGHMHSCSQVASSFVRELRNLHLAGVLTTLGGKCLAHLALDAVLVALEPCG